MFALAGGFAAGALVGYLFGSSRQATSGPVVAAPTTAAAVPPAGGFAPGPMPGMGLPNADAQNQLARLEALVRTDPKNHDAWVSLGNLYFDTHQAQRAVEAYGKALALKPDDPNVLTDQGVMYRELQQYDKALATFQKASKLDPRHTQSLFNQGVVLAYDLKKTDEAAKIWNQVIALAPESQQAAQARQQLSQISQAKGLLR